jgi:hypothetical protein
MLHRYIDIIYREFKDIMMECPLSYYSDEEIKVINALKQIKTNLQEVRINKNDNSNVEIFNNTLTVMQDIYAKVSADLDKNDEQSAYLISKYTNRIHALELKKIGVLCSVN